MVLIDTVYQRVLALANKEQRGYITPQEFNLFANQAQMDIFEQYFYDINQFGRLPGNYTEYSDMLNYLEEKIHLFETEKTININNAGTFYNFQSSADPYKIGSVSYNGSTCEKINANQIEEINKSPLLKPTALRPVYVLKNDYKIYLYPYELNTPGSQIIVNYIRKPVKVEWSGYNVDGAFQYNEDFSIDFELHPSEETKLVIKILGLAGITLKDPALYQIAGAEDNKNIQQEKQ